MGVLKGTVAVKFDLGQIVVTPRAVEALDACGQSPEDLLARHQAGDWGDISDAERQMNEEGLERQFSLVSSYQTAAGVKVTIVTKADRSCTLIHVGPAHS